MFHFPDLPIWFTPLHHFFSSTSGSLDNGINGISVILTDVCFFVFLVLTICYFINNALIAESEKLKEGAYLGFGGLGVTILTLLGGNYALFLIYLLMVCFVVYVLLSEIIIGIVRSYRALRTPH